MASDDDATAAKVHDLVVVGAGLVGAAAAKYFAELSRGGEAASVVLVGPSEASQERVGVYGCHADEGRICRQLDVDPVWAELARRAMGRYAEIEAASGVRFHSASGCLAVGRAGGPFLAAVRRTAEACGVPLEPLTEADMRRRWPDLRLDASLFGDDDDDDDDDEDCLTGVSAGGPSSNGGFETDASAAASSRKKKKTPVPYAGLYEAPSPTGAGHVSPRKLLDAQLALCRARGVAILDAVATSVSRAADGHTFDVRLDVSSLRARKVLIATNAWTNFRSLLPRRLALRLTTQTAVRRAARRVVIDRDDVRASVETTNGSSFFSGGGDAPWPCVIVKAGASPFGAVATRLDACYALPPTPYDDGLWYAKVGHGTFFEKTLRDADDAGAWYSDSEGEETRDAALARCRLAALLDRFVRRTGVLEGPNVAVRCVIPKTPTKRPYVFEFERGLGACVGCNGYAAKSSDELGRLAATMMLGFPADSTAKEDLTDHADSNASPWGKHIPPDAFRPVFEDELDKAQDDGNLDDDLDDDRDEGPVRTSAAAATE